jgi:hypothetical protein
MIFSIPEHEKDLWKSAAYFHTKRKMKKRKCKYGASIELHAPTSSTQKLKLMMKGGEFTYTPTLPLTCRLPQAVYVDIEVGCNYFN